MRSTIYLILSLLILSHSVMAFDSERQGIVIGAGIGFAPTASTEISGLNSSNESSSGVAISLNAGYGYDENTQFLFMFEATRVNSMQIDSVKENLWQGMSGVGVRFYFDEIGESFFVTSGIGILLYLNSSNAEFSHDAGLGVLVGGGYEFTEHFHLQTSMINGQTKDSFKWNHFQLQITVSGMLY